MPDRKLFYEDAARDRLDTRIVEAGVHEGRPFVRLEETVFYPEGGGQPADRGTIAGVPVVDVQSRGEEVLHVLERPLEAGPVTAILDVARRFDHRQQHTAQHLLSAILEDRRGRATTSFHLGESYTAIEIEGAPPGIEILREVEAEVNEAIRRDPLVTTRWVAPEELAPLAVRTRGLPEGHRGLVRLVEIEGIDRNTCGGTHVAHLAEIQTVHLVGAEAARGGARIRFLAGNRILGELARLEAIERSVKERIGTGADELAAVLDGWAEQRKRLERRVRDLEREAAEAGAKEMAAMPGPLLARILEDAGAEQLRHLASAVLARRPEAVVVLLATAAEERERSFLVQSGPAGPEDVAAIGTLLRDRLGAKGGGRGRIFQGRGGGRASEETIRDLG